MSGHFETVHRSIIIIRNKRVEVFVKQRPHWPLDKPRDLINDFVYISWERIFPEDHVMVSLHLLICCLDDKPVESIVSVSTTNANIFEALLPA